MSEISFAKVLIANRGEIAVRVARALHDLGCAGVAVFAQDDVGALHTQLANTTVALGATGPSAYLDSSALIAIAIAQGCDAVHPGYGFLSESAAFAQACADAGLAFIGPTPEQLALFGDKARARALAMACGVPLMPGLNHATSLPEAEAFFAEQTAQGAGGIVIKAVAGGGGRGMRVVERAQDVAPLWQRCTSEAQVAFGEGSVYVERLMPRARHIEVQVLGDGAQVVSLGVRECSLQRRFQKLVEMAPSPTLAPALRERIEQAALAMARQAAYCGLGTFEFLVDESSAELPFIFIEANPRLQVEHTVTEAVTGLDLVALQVQVAAGRTLAELDLSETRPVAERGVAIQWRINAETLDVQGHALPASGRIDQLAWPSGPGVRVDTHAQAGAAPSPHYDSLLAKLIVHAPDFDAALRRSQRALADCHIDGLATNLALLRALAARPEMASQQLHTRWLESVLPALLEDSEKIAASAGGVSATGKNRSKNASVLPAPDAPQGALLTPMPARLVQLSVQVGDHVAPGDELAVLEAMKMQHVLAAPHAGVVRQLFAQIGDYMTLGDVILVLEEAAQAAEHAAAQQAAQDPDHIRADLQRVIDRHARTLDAARPEAIAKRHARGQRTARENIADLCDEGSFIEYGALAIAAQTRRRSVEDLIANTPADGMVTGVGTVNSLIFDAERARTAVMAYDATVLAGTQGMRNHAKTDRILNLALQEKLPVVLFAEGGGGRPGDVDANVLAGLHVGTFAAYAALSGQVPVVGIVAGRCFAGNAALVGCSDVIIATKDSNLGMGGPAMIEGGGLGVFAPEDIGPSGVQHANGVIDVLVADEKEAVHAARQYLGFFQGRVQDWIAPDQRALRSVVPENRLRAYDTRAAMQGLVDEGSLLPLRTGFGAGIHTALARIEGRPVGLMANNTLHLGGAIDADAADKGARFMQLCNAHGLPIVSLIDTPGFMVGPEVEKTAQVRHVSRLFVVAGALRVPLFSVVLRKGYGLGAMGMAAGGFHEPFFTIAWPTGEFGGMGLEGAVRLGFRKELEAVAEGPERDALFNQLVAQQYQHGEAMNMATTLEIDAVIDPADTRDWLARGLASCSGARGPARAFVDTW
ncbi:MAG: carbamoyl-phosphate synthase large subunit [Burkholderiales bacterium]|nr:carbamoyl-phosphate synthase large subunit [Burkholderiales bacterium]